MRAVASPAEASPAVEGDLREDENMYKGQIAPILEKLRLDSAKLSNFRFMGSSPRRTFTPRRFKGRYLRMARARGGSASAVRVTGSSIRYTHNIPWHLRRSLITIWHPRVWGELSPRALRLTLK
ncbi:hypothetical protein KQX54_019343 [Cotesia glomerata]|uniref:Uncharacterized protein n=1 Tax=Cotesia glomerata TaxID=32391 RepID=A0AAV7IYJ3_COTGL|nr:hypothetical protein KQX54_019343 [Cotesia glomerata]